MFLLGQGRAAPPDPRCGRGRGAAAAVTHGRSCGAGGTWCNSLPESAGCRNCPVPRPLPVGGWRRRAQALPRALCGRHRCPGTLGSRDPQSQGMALGSRGWEGHQTTAHAVNIPPVPQWGYKATHSPVWGSMSPCCATGAALGYPGLEAAAACAGAWHVLPVPCSPGDTAASLQRGWAPVLAHWSDWFAGRKRRSCSRHDTRHIAVPSPPAGAALPSRCWERLNWDCWKPEGQGHSAHRCVQLCQGAPVAVSSDCHLLARTSSEKVAEAQAEPRLAASVRTPGDREGQG